MFIVIEGCDGTGKTTLLNAIKKHNSNIVCTKEPYDSKYINLIDNATSNLEAFLLFSLDRLKHIENIITPALNDGKTVYCDRYEASTWIYQHMIDNVDPELVSIVSRTISTLTPDFTILLYADRHVIIDRLQSRDKSDKRDPLNSSQIDLIQQCYFDYYRLYNNQNVHMFNTGLSTIEHILYFLESSGALA
jgi:dTMP kinase